MLHNKSSVSAIIPLTFLCKKLSVRIKNNSNNLSRWFMYNCVKTLSSCWQNKLLSNWMRLARTSNQQSTFKMLASYFQRFCIFQSFLETTGNMPSFLWFSSVFFQMFKKPGMFHSFVWKIFSRTISTLVVAAHLAMM